MADLVIEGLCFPSMLANHIEENPLKDILSVIKCTVSASDRFWRTIYESGIWIPRPVASKVVMDGWMLTVPVFGFALLFTGSFCMGIDSQMVFFNPESQPQKLLASPSTGFWFASWVLRMDIPLWRGCAPGPASTDTMSGPSSICWRIWCYSSNLMCTLLRSNYTSIPSNGYIPNTKLLGDLIGGIVCYFLF